MKDTIVQIIVSGALLVVALMVWGNGFLWVYEDYEFKGFIYPGWQVIGGVLMCWPILWWLVRVIWNTVKK